MGGAMADSDTSTTYAVGADPSNFTSGMDKVQAAAKQTAQSIQSSFQAIESSLGQVSSALKTVTNMFGALTAVAAGGSAFKEVIGASNEWTAEAKKLAVQMGVTTERASVMMVAMRHLGIDSETVTLAAGKLAKQISTNGQAFETLGVKVKDSAGQYRPTLDIMGEVNDKLKAIKNPIEQNIAGTQIYGKSWNDVRATLRLTSDEIKSAEQKTKDLGLVVGDEGVANARKYKEGMNDMKLVLTSLEVQAGAALLPVFVQLGAWLSGVGPTVAKGFGLVIEYLGDVMGSVAEVVEQLWRMFTDGFGAIGDIVAEVMGTKAPGAMQIFENILKLVAIAFVGLKVAAQVVIEAVMGYIELWVASMLRFAAVAERAVHLDWDGAKQAWATGTSIIEDVQQKHMDKLVQIAQAGKDKIDDIVTRGPKQGPEIKDKQIQGGPTYDFSKGKDDKEKSRIHEWEAKLEADKDGYAKEQAMQGTALEFSHAMEVDYWKKVLDTANLSTDEKAQVQKKYYTATAAVRKEDFDNEIAGEKTKLDGFKNNHIERLAISNQIYEENVARYGADSKEAKAALADVYKEQRAYADQELAIGKVLSEAKRSAELADIDAAEQQAQQELETRQINQAQLLELQQGYEAKRYQIMMQALLDEQALMHGPDEDPVALAKIHAQIETLEQQHQAKMTTIKQKAILEQNKDYLSVANTVESGMASAISSTLKGTTSIGGAISGLMSSVTGAVIDMLAKTAAQWLIDLAVREATGKVAAVGQVSANAGVAGAAATASAAAIPLIGWALAPEAGLAASAAAMAYMPMASASGGYDIPAGLNPIVQTHAEEMILPAKHANVIRQMADSGGGGSGQTINYHDHSGKLSPSDIKKNVRVIAEALKDHAKKS